jgi:hypothetical protein
MRSRGNGAGFGLAEWEFEPVETEAAKPEAEAADADAEAGTTAATSSSTGTNPQRPRRLARADIAFPRCRSGPFAIGQPVNGGAGGGQIAKWRLFVARLWRVSTTVILIVCTSVLSCPVTIAGDFDTVVGPWPLYLKVRITRPSRLTMIRRVPAVEVSVNLT